MSQSANSKYIKWVAKLGGDIQYLESASLSMNLTRLQEAAGKCKSRLERLYEHAEQFDIDLTKFYPMFSDMYARLLNIDARTEARNIPWWKKLFKGIYKIIRVIVGITGIPLPKWKDYLMLPSGEN